MSVPKTFTFLRILCLSQGKPGSHYQLIMTVNKARETAHTKLRGYEA